MYIYIYIICITLYTSAVLFKFQHEIQKNMFLARSEEFRGSLLEKVSGFASSALQQLTLQCDIHKVLQ